MGEIVQNNLRLSRANEAVMPMASQVKLADLSHRGSTEKTIPIGSSISPLLPSQTDRIKKPVSTDTSDLPTLPLKRAAALAGIAPLPAGEDPIEKLGELKEKLETEANGASKTKNVERAGYLVQMAKLIGEISITLNEWSDSKSNRVEEKKKKYVANSVTQEQAFDSKKRVSAVTAIVGLVAALGSGLVGVDAQAALSQINNLKEIFFFSYDAGSTKANQMNQLLIQELQKLNEASTNNNALRDQALQVLEAIKQWLKSAAPHG